MSALAFVWEQEERERMKEIVEKQSLVMVIEYVA